MTDLGSKIKDGFVWAWCETCETHMVICPRCGNNCCNGGYGPRTLPKLGEWGDRDEKRKCPVCPLTYQYAHAKGWQPGKDRVIENIQEYLKETRPNWLP